MVRADAGLLAARATGPKSLLVDAGAWSMLARRAPHTRLLPLPVCAVPCRGVPGVGETLEVSSWRGGSTAHHAAVCRPALSADDSRLPFGKSAQRRTAYPPLRGDSALSGRHGWTGAGPPAALSPVARHRASKRWK